jgi:hypothetical protein
VNACDDERVKSVANFCMYMLFYTPYLTSQYTLHNYSRSHVQFFPAVGKAYDDIVDSGYDAMMSWNGEMIKKVGHRRPNYEALVVLWFLKAFEVIIFEAMSVLEGSFLALFTMLSFMWMRVPAKPAEVAVSIATRAVREAN